MPILNPAALKERARSQFVKFGIMEPAVELYRWLHPARRPDQLKNWRRLNEIRRHFPARWDRAAGSGGKVLFLTFGSIECAVVEVLLVKALRAAGYSVQLVIPPNFCLRKAWEWLGESDFAHWHDFPELATEEELARAMDGLDSFAALMDYERDGMPVGKYAASTLMRQTRLGRVDLKDAEVRKLLKKALRESLNAFHTSRAILAEAPLAGVVMIDRGYTPNAQLFNAATRAGGFVITWNACHRDGGIVVKRYSESNKDAHPASLSEASWRRIRDMEWGGRDLEALHTELRDCYSSGQWFSEVATQVDKQSVAAAELGGQLGLDPGKKTAVIFAHIFWDATFFWGTDLFDDYEEWFVETVREAIKNDRMNWIVKIHPANVAKNLRDGIPGESSEVLAIDKHFGKLPDHVKMLKAESDVSTFSVFGLMDYCVTVRGTVGMESSCLGKTVLTAGTGRYDRLGFTIDSDSREQYLERLRTLETAPGMTEAEKELANRYSYGVFLGRVLNLRSVSMEFEKNTAARLVTGFRAKSEREFMDSADVKELIDWIASGEEDLLDPDRIAPKKPTKPTNKAASPAAV